MSRKADPLPIFDADVWFVPDVVLEDVAGNIVWNNREDPEPMAVRISPLSQLEFDRQQIAFATRQGTKLAKARKGKMKEEDLAVLISERSDGLRAKIIGEHVKEVRGWSCEELEPKTGAELVAALNDPRVRREEREAILGSIFHAIGDASVLDEGLLGKFVSPSGSQSAAESSGQAGSGSGAAIAAGANGSSRTAKADGSQSGNGASSTTAMASPTQALRLGTPGSIGAPGRS